MRKNGGMRNDALLRLFRGIGMPSDEIPAGDGLDDFGVVVDGLHMVAAAETIVVNVFVFALSLVVGVGNSIDAACNQISSANDALGSSKENIIADANSARK